LVNAAADYKKAVELDDSRSVAFIQLGMTQYRLGEKRAAEATFRRAARAFPNSAHVRIFHSELLIDQQRFDDAEKLLEEASKLDPTNALAWVNRALLYMQKKGDPVGAEELLKKAIEGICEIEKLLLTGCTNTLYAVDNECEAAMISLAQIYLQQSKLADALALFERGMELARTEQEISTMIGYCEVSIPI
jgi:import receptor subunit TOM70